ncbi:MAG: lipid asymmetry maintenance protein MlaB [Gammaproteobacteria bacterium]
MLTGPLNSYTALHWAAKGQEWINDAKEQCVIDLANTTSIDSAGIAILLAWKRYANQQKKTLFLQNPSEKLRSMLHLYGLAPVFPSSL